MKLKNIFKMTKTDRYTQDGRDELAKLQETEDVKYKTGDISQKTGLQKQPDGSWAPPKSNGVIAQQKQKMESEKYEAARRDAQAPSKKTEVNTPGLRKDVQEAIKRSSPEEIKAYIKELRTPGSRMSRYFDNPDLLANVYEDELNKITESKPAAQEVKLGGGADTYYFEDPDNMSNEDKVFKSLDIELDSSFGDRNGNPDDVESWVEAWKENIKNEGGIGVKSRKTRQPAAPIPAEEALEILKKNPARLKNLIKRAKKFYSGSTMAGGFDDWGGKGLGEDSAPRELTGDCKIKIRPETQDVKYNTGDISQKTGLQKQPDGSWAPPKNGAGKNVHGAEIDKIYEKHQKRIKELKAKGYTDEQIENDKIYQQTKEDMRNVGKSKPADVPVEKFDIEKWKTGPKVKNNAKLDWSHGVVGESIPVQGKSAEEKRNLINKYNSVGRLSRIGTKKNSYYNNKHGTFEVAGMDNDNVYIQEERRNGLGSTYTVLVTIPLNEVEEINPFHDYGKRNPETGEESPTRPPLPEDSAPRILTGDTKIRIRK